MNVEARPGEPSESRAAEQSDLQHVVAAGRRAVPLIPAGAVFEGQISMQGATRIDGVVRGTVRGTGLLEVGPQGRIEGLVECERVRNEGAIVGPLVAQGHVILAPGAYFEGELHAPTLEVADSATWNGVARVGPSPCRIPTSSLR